MTVIDNPALPQEDDPFGLWTPAPVGPGMAFATTQALRTAEPGVREVELPADVEAAQATLQRKHVALLHGETLLAQADRRVARIETTFAERPPGLAFAAPAGLPAEEQTLWDKLLAFEVGSAETLRKVEAEQEPIREQWERFARQVRYTVSHPVQVKTRAGANLIGYTAMDWLGDMHTIWEPGIEAAMMALHHQSLDLVLAKLTARLRLLIVVGTGAARIAARLSNPATQWMVIPATWKFVRDVLEVLREQPEFNL